MDVTLLDRAVHHLFVAIGPAWSGHTLLVVHHVVGWLLVATAVAFVLVPDRESTPNGRRRWPAKVLAVVISVVIVIVVVLGYGSAASAADPASPAIQAPVSHSGSELSALPGVALAVVAGLFFMGALLVITVVKFALETAWAVAKGVGGAVLPAFFATLLIVVVLAAVWG